MQLLQSVPDEVLFNNMTQGDVLSHDILYMRCERLGRQIAGVLIRTNQLYGLTDQDFIGCIDEGIRKVFHYYSSSKIRFFIYCREILNQCLAKEIQEVLAEKEATQNMIPLDENLHGSATLTYHDVIPDKYNLSSSKEYDVDKFLNVLSSPTSEKNKNRVRIITMSAMGYTIAEIASKTRTSKYFVRCVLERKE